MNNHNKYKYNKYKQKYNNLKKEIKYITSLEYPYYNLFYQLSLTKFNNIITHNKSIIHNNIPKTLQHQSFTKYNNNYIFIEQNWELDEEINNITDWFTEQCRVQCQFANNIPPYKYWSINKTKIINSCLNKYHNVDIRNIRNDLYYNTKLCNNFRISVGIAILKIFNAKKWLDISAGWGDRLISAIAHNVELYCGIDPNPCLYPKYKTIIDTLVLDKDKHKYILIKDGFESAKLPDTKFDIVFSSPPFFDLEIYSDATNDSMIKYNTVDKWYSQFLIPSLEKAYNYLDNNGHLVLYMGEGIKTKYISHMVAHMNNIMKYEGSIYYFYPQAKIQKPRELYVWVKN